MDFKNFQKNFLKVISTSDVANELIKEIRTIGKLNVDEVISIYRQDYVARLSEALGEFFESVWFVLGDDDFFKLAKEYVESNPSSVQDLANYGRHFPEYLKKTSYQREFPFLFELASLEQSYWDFFHKKGTPYQDPWDSLNPEQFGDLKLKFPQDCRTFSSEYSLASLFMARKNKLNSSDNENFNWSLPEHAFLYKSSDQVGLIHLTIGQKLIIDNLLQGKCVSDSLELAADIDPQEVSQLFSLLKSHQVQLELVL